MSSAFERLRQDPEICAICGALTDYAAERETQPPQKSLDWERFTFLAQRHRVGPIVYFQCRAWLSNLSKSSMGLLENAYRANAFKVLRIGAEQIRLVEGLAARGIEVRVLKGLPLASLLYRRAADRHCGDVDLLLSDASRWLDAHEVICGLGYVAAVSPFSLPPRARPLYRSLKKEIDYVSPDGRTVLELHWHSPAVPTIPAFMAESWAGGHTVRIEGLVHEWEVPQEEDLLIYLAAHGTRFRWARLKWFVDILLMTARLREGSAPHLSARAEVQGLKRHWDVMLVCLTRLFGFSFPLKIDALAESLAEDCAMLLASEIVATGKFDNFFYSMRLEHSRAMRGAILRNAYFRLQDCRYFNLSPLLLTFTSPFIRVPSLVYRWTKSQVQRT